jgi:hypothetical protein
MLRALAGVLIGLGSLGGIFASLPTTTNYSLQSYGFGSGGGSTSTANYSLEGITGELSGQTTSTSNYSTLPGFIQTEQANVPKVTLTNPSSYYDKLKFVIDQQGNPSDALYALQVCVGADFSPTSSSPTCPGGTIQYVKNDHTLGSTLTLADYHIYTAWGGAGGTTIIGLTGSTTYYIHAKATQGQFTESGYGPSSNAATVAQQISFCLYTSGSCGGGGNTIAFGNINVNSVNTPPTDTLGTDFATNADNGGSVYIYSLNGGLKSASSGYIITSATANLASVAGFGAQILSVSQSSGGPLTKVSPYDGSSNNVGALSTTVSTLLNSTAPLTLGTASTQLQVRPDTLAVPKSDYLETLTVIAAASF